MEGERREGGRMRVVGVGEGIVVGGGRGAEKWWLRVF